MNDYQSISNVWVAISVKDKETHSQQCLTAERIGQKTGSLERRNCVDVAALLVGSKLWVVEVVGVGEKVVAMGVIGEVEAREEGMEGRVVVDEGGDISSAAFNKGVK
ncbi:hypothetical protein VNO78_05320 [Psophocarpus tetragonolobus]|uniref:Uncharacterized protein n=1 Tax=Psophocarpus tetragonolobus TaxID=3891 RepID=A0AAN9STI4_PSOTE